MNPAKTDILKEFEDFAKNVIQLSPKQTSIKLKEVKSKQYYQIVFRDDDDVDLSENPWAIDVPNIYKCIWEAGMHNDPRAKPGFNTFCLFETQQTEFTSNLYQKHIKSINLVKHDDLLCEIIRIWFEIGIDYDMEHPRLMTTYTSPYGSDYIRLHFNSMHNDAIKKINVMVEFFETIYEILPSDCLNGGVMVEIPLKQNEEKNWQDGRTQHGHLGTASFRDAAR